MSVKKWLSYNVQPKVNFGPALKLLGENIPKCMFGSLPCSNIIFSAATGNHYEGENSHNNLIFIEMSQNLKKC